MSVDFYWRDKEDAENWRALYHRRKNREDFTISYESRTVKCGFGVFEYAEKTEIQPWPPD